MVIINDEVQIKILDEVIKILHSHVQWNDIDCEAGGIIIGRENISNNNVIIEFVTEPMKNDYCTQTKYIRKDSGHLNFYKLLYDNNYGIYAYFGEWHTHPQDKPRYSLIDLATWRRICKESPKDVQYHIIVGRKYITFWKMKKIRFYHD